MFVQGSVVLDVADVVIIDWDGVHISRVEVEAPGFIFLPLSIWVAILSYAGVERHIDSCRTIVNRRVEATRSMRDGSGESWWKASDIVINMRA